MAPSKTVQSKRFVGGHGPCSFFAGRGRGVRPGDASTEGRPSRAACSATGLEPVLQHALDAGVEGVEAVERERFGGTEAATGLARGARAARAGVGAVVGEDAMQ